MLCGFWVWPAPRLCGVADPACAGVMTGGQPRIFYFPAIFCYSLLFGPWPLDSSLCGNDGWVLYGSWVRLAQVPNVFLISLPFSVIPCHLGRGHWIPACAGMTVGCSTVHGCGWRRRRTFFYFPAIFGYSLLFGPWPLDSSLCGNDGWVLYGSWVRLAQAPNEFSISLPFSVIPCYLGRGALDLCYPPRVSPAAGVESKRLHITYICSKPYNNGKRNCRVLQWAGEKRSSHVSGLQLDGRVFLPAQE